MNHMFLGAITREDMQVLDQTRRQLLPMLTNMSGLQADMFAALHSGNVVEPAQIRRFSSITAGYVASINGFINGSYRRETEDTKDTKGNPQKSYRDILQDANKDKLAALHAFPQAPFPMGDEALGHLAIMLLDKRLGQPEEKWIEERLQKAAEFAHVPPQWGIEPKKPAPKAAEDDNDSDDDMKGWDDNIPTKRIKGSLNEDDLKIIWGNGHRTAFNRQYWEQMKFGNDGDEQEAETPAEGEDQNMEDEEEYEEEEDEEGAPSAPVVMIQKAPASVHKAVPGTPIMALGFVHRFMTSGEVRR